MSKSVIAIIAAAVVLLVAILVGVQVLGGDDAPSSAEDFTGAEEVAALVEGIPQKGAVLGRPDAPVTIVEYIDYKCPICAQASTEVVPTLIEEQVRTGKVKMELRPIAFIGPDSERGALGGEAAAMQDGMWQFSELLLRNQGDESDEWITDQLLSDAATAAGLDRARFDADYAGSEVVDAFVANRDAADSDGVTGTPYWVISGPGGTESFSGVPDDQRFTDAIAKAAGAQQ